MPTVNKATLVFQVSFYQSSCHTGQSNSKTLNFNDPMHTSITEGQKTYHNLHLFNCSVYVYHSTVASTDDRLVLQNDDLMMQYENASKTL